MSKAPDDQEIRPVLIPPAPPQTETVCDRCGKPYPKGDRSPPAHWLCEDCEERT